MGNDALLRAAGEDTTGGAAGEGTGDGQPADQPWDTHQRRETATERLDRNWGSLLQELRVTQTGVQLLTGFLLTLPFQQRFTTLGTGMTRVYLATVACSVGATVLLVAPVGMHRVLFRRHRVAALVEAGHRCAYAGILLLGAALVGVTVVVFDAVAGALPAWIAGVLAVVMLAILWLILPLMLRREPETR